MNEQTIQEFTIIEDYMIEDEAEENAATDTADDHVMLLPRMLRALGAIIIAACASIFLFQKWGLGNDIQRYLFLLGFTATLTAGGFFCGLKLRESKGARTLLSLTVAIAPVNFTVLGALLYSQFSHGGGLHSLPSFVTWVAPTPTAALLTAAGSLMVLAVLCYVSFLTLGRIRARFLTGCYFLSNLVLLVPTRQPDSIGLMLLVVVVGLAYCELKYFRHEPTLRTLEGRLSRAALWVPPLLLVGRSSYLYYASGLLHSSILAVVALIGFIFLPTLTRQVHVRKIMQGLSMFPAVLSWLALADVLFRSVSIGAEWAIPLYVLPSAMLLIVVSLYAIGSGTGYRRSAALIALTGGVANLCLFPGLTASFVCLLTGVVILIYGFIVEQKILFFSGGAGLLVGLGYHLKYALSLYSLFNWGSLAVTGVTIIIVASLLERQQGQVRDNVQAFRNRLKTWSH